MVISYYSQYSLKCPKSKSTSPEMNTMAFNSIVENTDEILLV